jgi:hypothetical protein
VGFQLKGVDIDFGFRTLRLRRRTLESSLIKTATPFSFYLSPEANDFPSR